VLRVLSELKCSSSLILSWCDVNIFCLNAHAWSTSVCRSVDSIKPIHLFGLGSYQCEVGVADSEVSTPLGHTSPYGFSNTLFIIPKHGTKNTPTTPHRCAFGLEALLWLHSHCYVSECDCTFGSDQLFKGILLLVRTNDKQEISRISKLVFSVFSALMHLFGKLVMVGGWCGNFSLQSVSQQ